MKIKLKDYIIVMLLSLPLILYAYYYATTVYNNNSVGVAVFVTYDLSGEPKSLREAWSRAELVVIGIIRKLEFRETRSGFPITYAYLEVKACLKGNTRPGDIIVVAQPGCGYTTVFGIKVKVELKEDPMLKIGEVVLLLLKKVSNKSTSYREDVQVYTYDHLWGRYEIIKGRIYWLYHVVDEKVKPIFRGLPIFNKLKLIKGVTLEEFIKLIKEGVGASH